jgi:O-antigen ligase
MAHSNIVDSTGVLSSRSCTAFAVEAPRTGDIDGSWDLLLVAIAGYILTAVGRVHQLFPAVGAIRPAILTGVVAILLFLCDRAERRRLHLLWCPTTRYVLALLLWMVLSTSGAIRIGNSLDMLVDNLVKTILMYLVIVAGVRGPRDVERLAVTYLASATVYAAVVLSRFDLDEGDAWRLGHLYYYDANDFATLAVSAMPLGLYVCHRARRASRRALGMLALGTLASALVYTGSRGGFIALLAVVAFILFGYRAIDLRWRLCGAALVALVVIGTASDQYWRQMSTIVSDADYNRTEEGGRMQIWRRGVGYMLRYPVFGVGPGNFQTAEGTLSPLAERQQYGIGVRWSAAHNSFIQAGAELGLPGLLLFTAVIVSAFHGFRRSNRRESVFAAAGCAPELTQALCASLIGFVVGAFFLSLAYAEMLFTLVALAVALQKVSRLS